MLIPICGDGATLGPTHVMGGGGVTEVFLSPHSTIYYLQMYVIVEN